MEVTPSTSSATPETRERNSTHLRRGGDTDALDCGLQCLQCGLDSGLQSVQEDHRSSLGVPAVLPSAADRQGVMGTDDGPKGEWPPSQEEARQQRVRETIERISACIPCRYLGATRNRDIGAASLRPVPALRG